MPRAPFSIRFRGLALAALVLGIAVLGIVGCQGGTSPDDDRASGDVGGASGEAASTSIGGPDFNVLLVSVDTTRADYLGCYGHPLSKTPNIDRFASQGTRFAQCISSAPLTLPSHATMLTGSYQFVHGARDNGAFNLAEENITLAEIFKAAGWATHGEVAAMVLNRKYGLAQGFDTFGDVERKSEAPRTQPFAKLWDRDVLEESTDPDIQPERPRGETDRKADEITRRGIELLRAKAQANERFFMFLHYFDPHWPHEAPERFTSQLPDGYLAEIAFFDEQFGELMDALSDLGLSDRTLVILTSDHGEGRREHGEDTHSMFLYDSTLHVPLIMWSPGQIPAGQVVQEQVRLVDLAPTILEFVELERTDQMQGTSLLPFVADPTLDMRLPCYSDTMVPQNALNYSPLRSLRVDGWKYILSPRSELYHVAEDHREVFNLVQLEAQRAGRMKQELREIIAQSPEPVAGRGEVRALDEDEARQLAALGYLGTNLDYVDRSASELDHFEPEGISPRDRMEVVECWANGLGAFNAGQFEVAEKFYRRFLELEPASALAASFLGKCLISQQRTDEAIAMFRLVEELKPDGYEHRRTLGNLLALNGEYAEAMQRYRVVIEHNSKEVVSRINLGILLTAQRRFDPALGLYEEALQIDSELPRIHLHKGKTLNAAGRFEKAIPALTEALRLSPRLVPAHMALVTALKRTGQTTRAIQHIEQAIQDQPDEALLHNELGRIHTDGENQEDAGASFARVVELLPESAIAHRHLGTNFLLREHYDEAIDQLRQALELAPEFPIALHHLANALQATGELAEAVRTYDKLLELAPRYAPGYIPAAMLRIRTEDGAGAIELMRRGQEQLPDRVDLANTLAWLLATSSRSELRNGPEALALAEHAAELSNAKDANVLDTLAAAYAEVGRFEDAVAAADRAIEAARHADDAQLADDILARRAQYEVKQPYRE